MLEAAVSDPTSHPDAAADGIIVRRLATLDEYQEAVVIQDETWGAGFAERVPTTMLNVAQRIGGVAAGAFAPSGRLVGFVFGLTGIEHGRLVHWSDMLAVREEARGRHLGDRLKMYQRELVRAIGVETMLWTFDPLVARNAHFNLNRLGARPREYVPNMYGANTGSALHGTLDTDRFIAAWDLRTDAERHVAPAPASLAGIPIVNAALDDGPPALGALGDAPVVAIEIPADIHAVQQHDPECAARWRATTRAAFLHYLARDYAVTGFIRGAGAAQRPAYLLTRGASA